MKRFIKLFAILSVLMLMLVPLNGQAEVSLVVDECNMLSNEEFNSLEQKLKNVSDKYDVDVVALIAQDTRGKDLVAFADDYYDENGYGRGTDRSGIIFVIDMNYREIYFSTSGKCINYFTDYGLDSISEQVVRYLPNNPYGAIDKYGQLCEEYIEKAITDKPVDLYWNTVTIHMYDANGKGVDGKFTVYNQYGDYLSEISVFSGEGYTDLMTDDTHAVYRIVCKSIESGYDKPEEIVVHNSSEYDINIKLGEKHFNYLLGGSTSGILGLITAFISTAIMKGKNRSVSHRYEARDYVRSGSFGLFDRRDTYLYSTRNRTRRPTNDGSRSYGGGGSSSHRGGSYSGGSSTHHSSSGASHGGGGRRGF